MLNVIICDDNKRDLSKVVRVVDSFMKRNKYGYKIHCYSDYNAEFTKIIKSNIPFKIYILDIETPSRSGIDIAREIRKKDLDSVIVFLTGHEELGNIVLKNDLMFLSFVNKFDNLENRLVDVLYKAINLVKKKQVLKIEDGNNTYIIDINDILYISKESVERKTIIITDYTEYRINLSMAKVYEMLDDRFIKTHRACIVNKLRITRIDRNKNNIYFDNNVSIDLLSNKYKKELAI